MSEDSVKVEKMSQVIVPISIAVTKKDQTRIYVNCGIGMAESNGLSEEPVIHVRFEKQVKSKRGGRHVFPATLYYDCQTKLISTKKPDVGKFSTPTAKHEIARTAFDDLAVE